MKGLSGISDVDVTMAGPRDLLDFLFGMVGLRKIPEKFMDIQSPEYRRLQKTVNALYEREGVEGVTPALLRSAESAIKALEQVVRQLGEAADRMAAEGPKVENHNCRFTYPDGAAQQWHTLNGERRLHQRNRR